MEKDLISRQAAIDTIERAVTKEAARWLIKELPSAQPERWIPCSERLPERWIPCSEQLPEYGVAVLTYNSDDEYEVNHIIDEDDGEWFFDGAIAWIPLPEPYREDGGEA